MTISPFREKTLSLTTHTRKLSRKHYSHDTPVPNSNVHRPHWRHRNTSLMVGVRVAKDFCKLTTLPSTTANAVEFL